MNKLSESIIFSFFISLVMVVLDAIYHLATETAVHINYVAVKFTIIFLVVFLVAYWVGKSPTEGIFTSIAGPVIFYAYYIFANPTLNRELFKIDENFGYIFVHIAALLIAYFLIYRIWMLKKGPQIVKSLAYAFIISLCIYGLDAAFQLSYVQFTTHNEEEAAKVLDFTASAYLLGLLFALSFLSYHFIRNKNVQMAVLVFGSAVVIYFLGNSLIRSLAGFAGSSLLVYLAKNYMAKK